MSLARWLQQVCRVSCSLASISPSDGKISSQASRQLRSPNPQGQVTLAIYTRNISRRLLISLCLCSVGSATACALTSTPPSTDLLPLMDAPGGTLPDAPEAQVPVTEK